MSENSRLLHPAKSPDEEWWRHAVVYQVYPRSFRDGNGDGLGDLPGITAGLDYLADLGVDAVWLSPFYPSPQADAGYDVANYRDVDPRLGTLADFDAMLAKAHNLGLKLIVDLVPNHTSDEHVWFQAALKAGPGSPERARYMFREGRGEHGELPPNNWQSVFSDTAWTRIVEADGQPGQWYLHLFDTKQPDLNWENPEVVEEFHTTIRFWLDRGVDGFRVDVAHGLMKEAGLPDVDPSITGLPVDIDRGITGACPVGPMWDQEPVHKIYNGWHAVASKYAGDRMFVAEAWVEPHTRMANYVRSDEMQQSFNFPYLRSGWYARELRGVIKASFEALDQVNAVSTWVLSNHDVVRHASRFGYASGVDPSGGVAGVGPNDPQPDRVLGLRRARAGTMIMLSIPGSAYVYQGEELGLPEHTTLPGDVRQDPTWFRSHGTLPGRDGCRVPIPWQASQPAFGFSTAGRSWLPQPADWAEYAMDAERGKPGSTLELYRSLLAARKEHHLGSGSFEWVNEPTTDSDHIFAFINNGVLIFANIGGQPAALPAVATGGTLLASSEPVDVDASGAIVVPTDCTVWVKLV